MYRVLAFIFIHICADSSQTVLEHHRSFIPSTLVSQLEEEKKQDRHWELNLGPPATGTQNSQVASNIEKLERS